MYVTFAMQLILHRTVSIENVTRLEGLAEGRIIGLLQKLVLWSYACT